jgi:F420-0:gamma-glutamyl ligase
MAQNPEMQLWRTVLAYSLHDDDPAIWLYSADGGIVCALAGLDRDAVARALAAGLPEFRHRAA